MRALRRPNAPAGAINRAVRSDPARRALLDAAQDLRQAHEAVMGGSADRETLRAAVAAERQASGGARGDHAAAEAGGDVSADRAASSRHARGGRARRAVRRRFAAGTLRSDARAAGLAADLAPPPRPPAPWERRGQAKAEQEQRRLAEAVRRAEAEVERRREEVEAAERARERADAARA
jgi:colicin import membrane protein